MSYFGGIVYRYLDVVKQASSDDMVSFCTKAMDKIESHYSTILLFEVLVIIIAAGSFTTII